MGGPAIRGAPISLALHCVLAATGLARPLTGQVPTFPTLIECDGTALPPTETATLVVSATVASRRPDQANASLRRERDARILRGYAGAFVAPEHLDIPQPIAWDTASTPAGAQLRSFGPLAAAMMLVLDTGGHVSFVQLLEASASAPLNAALVAAVHRAESSGAWSALPPIASAPDTVWLGVSAERHRPRAAEQLFETQQSYLPISQPVSIISQPTPQYPTAALAAGVETQVDLDFLVLPSGAPTSIRARRARDGAFVQAAIDAVQGSSFRPAMAGQCRVSDLARQSFRFSLAEGN